LLKQVSAALKKNSALRVKLEAYARGNSQNASQARRLSLSRALAVRAGLMNQGVKPTRIDIRALGNKVPGGTPNRVDVTVGSR
jgi:outer membrane protein OmpA-like peptidoglycan-associated protein